MKRVGRQRAALLYADSLESSTPQFQQTMRAAMIKAYPDMADSLPGLVIDDVTPMFPESAGRTAQLTPGSPLRGTRPPAAPKPTGEALKSYTFGIQALGSNNIIDRLEAKGETGTNVLLATLDKLANTGVVQGAAAGAVTGGAVGTAVGAVVLPTVVGLVLRNPSLGPMTKPLAGVVGGGVGSAVGGAVGALTVLMAEPLASITRRMYGADSQAYLQAKNDFIAAVLRKTSGAAINRDEYEREEKRYFPSPLDTDEVIKQKAAARARTIRGFEKEAGTKLVP
jgi:hypothetical protein